jgi:hypothetical protein
MYPIIARSPEINTAGMKEKTIFRGIPAESEINKLRV